MLIIPPASKGKGILSMTQWHEQMSKNINTTCIYFIGRLPKRTERWAWTDYFRGLLNSILCYGLARVRREPGGVGDGAGALCGGGGRRQLAGRSQVDCSAVVPGGWARRGFRLCGAAPPRQARQTLLSILSRRGPHSCVLPRHTHLLTITFFGTKQSRKLQPTR